MMDDGVVVFVYSRFSTLLFSFYPSWFNFNLAQKRKSKRDMCNIGMKSNETFTVYHRPSSQDHHHYGNARLALAW